MHGKLARVYATIGVAISTGAVFAPTFANDDRKPIPEIYSTTAVGSKQLTDALSIAKKRHKRVLVVFGANWCIWCRRLHNLFETNEEISHKLRESFIVVLIDTNNGRNADIDTKYGFPTKQGLPVLVVIDEDGKHLATQETGVLEEGDHHSAEKVLAFLKQWS